MQHIITLFLLIFLVLPSTAESHGFAAGTLVKTPSSYQQIENIRVGDAVLAFDCAHACTVTRQVTNVICHQAERCRQLVVGTEVIVTDDIQRFYLTYPGSWVPVCELGASDLLKTCAGSLLIHELGYADECITLFDLVVAEDHTYCVTESDIIVHNPVGIFCIGAPLLATPATPVLCAIAPVAVAGIVGTTCAWMLGKGIVSFVREKRRHQNDVHIVNDTKPPYLLAEKNVEPSAQQPIVTNDNDKSPNSGKEPEDPEKNPTCKTAFYSFTLAAIEEGVEYATTDRKIEHIFEKTYHNLGPLIEELGGHIKAGYVNTAREVLRALSGKVQFNDFFEDLVINVRGYEVYVRGKIIEGIPKLGTFFIKKGD